MIQDFLREHWNNVPDNEELQLGDAEWYEMTYENKV